MNQLTYLELGETTLKELRRLLNLSGWTLVDTAPHNTSIKLINDSEYKHTLFLVQVYELCTLPLSDECGSPSYSCEENS